MEIESPLELSIRNDRPPSSTDRVHFVSPFPGKFQTFCILIGRKTIIQIPMHSAKLKLSQMILSERDIAWDNEVDVILIPLLHLDNTPCSHVLIAHGVRLYLRLHTPRAYVFSTLRRKAVTALSSRVCPCWST